MAFVDLITTAKHPTSVMSLGIVASNGLVMSLIWFPVGYRLTKKSYVVAWATKLIPWVQNNLPGSNVVVQQDRPPPHIAKVVQIHDNADMPKFWSNMMWSLCSANANPLDYAFCSQQGLLRWTPGHCGPQNLRRGILGGDD